MFPKVFFANAFFPGQYFAPVDGSAPPVDEGRPPLAGFILNMGTMINR
jgi:hypothetical protein